MWIWPLLLAIVNSTLMLGAFFGFPQYLYKLNTIFCLLISLGIFYRIIYKIKQGRREARRKEINHLKEQVKQNSSSSSIDASEET